MELQLDHVQLFFDTGTGFRQANISPLPAIGNRLIDVEINHMLVFFIAIFIMIISRVWPLIPIYSVIQAGLFSLAHSVAEQNYTSN